jgi:hypothetical protein
MFKLAVISLFLLLSPNAPKIVEQGPAVLENCSLDDDPFGCHAVRMIVENPLRRKVLVRINCGSDLDETEVTIFPRTKQELVIQSDLPGTTCRIGSWQSLEEKK